MASTVIKLLLILLLQQYLSLYDFVESQQMFQQDPVPDPFELDDRYPNRDEFEECRPIKLQLERTSSRFSATITQNTNPDLNFANADASLMTSRLKSRLDILADLYTEQFGGKLNVLLTYAEADNPLVTTNDSLHFEGRTSRIAGSNAGELPEILQLAVQAGFDWVVYDDVNYARVSVIPDVCQTNLDLLFLLDESGSVGSSNHQLGLQFMESVVGFYDISPDGTRVAVISFSSGAREEFDFDHRFTLRGVQRSIRRISYNGGYTHTALALELATELFNDPSSSGARPASAGIPRVVVLITDGRSNTYSITQPAIDLRAAGVTVYSIGIGNYNLNELLFIASDPDSDHVFLLQSYTDAAFFTQLLRGTTCDTPATISACDESETEAPQDDFRYFQVECSLLTENVVVELTETAGQSAIYVSTEIVNPSPVNSPAVTYRNEEPATIGITKRLIVPTNQKKILYIAVRGISDSTNSFKLAVYNDLFMESSYPVTVHSGVFDDDDMVIITLDTTGSNTDSFLFEIIDGNDAGNFRIDNDGKISLNNALDAMTQDAYTLTILASNMADQCQCGRTTVQISVLASNNHSPIFQETSPVDISESTPADTVVVTVTATDADFGINGEVRYSITSGNTRNVFEIDPITGEITLVGALNHTITQSYTLTLTADDQAVVNPRNDTTTQVIIIVDVNQHPFFLTQCAAMELCRFMVSEGADLSTTIAMIMAGDPDSSSIPNGQLTFSLTPTDPFTVDNDGNFALVTSLDRESRETYTLNLTVADGGMPSLQISTIVTFTVTDINDNAPVLVAPAMVDISESTALGTEVTQVQAFDPDLGVNGEVSYQLTGSTLFDIDKDSGQITLVRSLDYEVSTQHVVTVVATDAGNMSSTGHAIMINVINENDNAPVFAMDPYTTSVDEGSSEGTEVIIVQADDADSGVLGEVSYSITGGNSNNNFAINSTSGTITVNGEIDREAIGEYTLTIRAQDGGNPARSDISTVVITVNDINDNNPVFQQSLYERTVREDVNVPLDVLTLLATDADEANTPNSAITYSIQSGNTGSVFTLHANTGVLSVASALDFETTPSYSLTVVATDGGGLTGNAVVMVTVVDVNDETPILSPDQTVSYPEDTSTPTVVATFTASGEMGEVLEFQLSGDQNGEFEIDMNTGQVSLVQSLDYESRQQYGLTVSVTDGQFSTTSALTITVTDVNDNTPIIDSAGPFTIMEQESANSLVGSVTASDQDSGSNAQLSFQITQQPLNLFMIVPDGSNAVQIQTANVLDREALVQMNYFLPPNSQSEITIEVSDGGNPSLTSSVTVVITLEDINDNAPTLVNPVTEVNISESSNTGTLVTQITATDIDIGANARVSYSLISNSLFTIDSTTGDVTLAGSLDYETNPEHTIMVYASNPDGLNSTEHNITINVIDENDNSPVFTMDPYAASVAENSSMGTLVVTVQADDADSGILGEVEYTITDGNINDVFSIGSTSGEITVGGDLDRELFNEYTLTVTASNPGMLSRMSTARVVITITDVNDNTPLFTQPRYALDIREDASLTSILTVVVTDADQPGTVNSQFDITISSGNDNNLFTISSPSGVLSLSSSLDFEMQTSHELTLTAADRGDPSLSSTSIVAITVINVNDEVPQISGNQTIPLSEFTPIGSNITQFTATKEEGETLVFSLVPANCFAINSSSGMVTLIQPLDYETQQSFTARVLVSDGLFSSSAYLTVNVVDENDNAPQIAPAGPFTVIEEMPAGTLVGVVSASDADSVSAALMYSFIGDDVLDYFNINSSNGEIRTSNVLDREALTSVFTPPSSSQVYTVSVSDGTFSPTIDITFQLLDINDNAPMFTNLMSPYDIDENSPLGTEVFVATATDADLGSNAIVSYSIPSSPFTINENTGSVTVSASLDYEDVTEYTVTITASDGTLSSNESVTIQVIDVNDNPPIFSMNSYTAQVVEHSSINTSVVNISATDADSGAFGMISFALEGDNGAFRIDSTTGEIVINGDIDREVITQFSFTVVASDGGSPVMSSSSSVVVTITDINDNAPVFQQSSYIARVREDAAVSTEIITVMARDADEVGNPNSQIDYALLMNSMEFTMSPSGVLNLIAPLNFEARESYTLTAIATDRGSPMMNGTATINIIVINVNDQPPTINGSQSLTLSELNTVPDQIAIFNAISDTGEAITYQLIGTQNGEFEINSTTGVVTLVKSLDYETTQFYALMVNASDNVSSTISDFNITVTDENDNTPQFQSVDILIITEEEPHGTLVGQVTASDADSGENAILAYSIVDSGILNLFSINSSTGELFTAIMLDRETLVRGNLFLPPASQLTFSVQVTDMGTPSLFSQMDVTVQLNDINDNSPMLVNLVTTASVSESANIGTMVTTISAIDIDLGNNAEISYSLTGATQFTINSTTGVVTLVSSLDYEMSTVHTITVTASNPDGLSSTGHDITIHVINENDNAPVFSTNPYSASVAENSDPGTSVVMVEAVDEDLGLLGQVRYFINDDNITNTFSINVTSGEISVIGDTDRESIDFYSFEVKALDSGSTTVQTGITTVNIVITDTNDNAPVFDQSLYQVDVLENITIPALLLVVNATDADLPNSPNSMISYSLNNGFGVFEIDTATGSVSVMDSLDFETQSSYSLQVMATDSGQPSLTGTAQIMIDVINVNDQIPQLSDNQMIELSELTTTMSRITQFTATGEEGETLLFSLDGVGAGTVFDIDSATGIVTLIASLDYEMTTSYSYMVTVSDGMFTSSASSLSITVVDENDNTPQFTSNNVIVFQEELMMNRTVIGQINATDVDSGVNGQLSYSFVLPRANTFFTINNNTGEISTAVVVDREGLAAMNALIMESQIMFDVQVSDNGNPARFSTQTVTFMITDINDNAPEFVNPPTMIPVSEAAMTGYEVTELQANDIDLGENAVISYSLTGATQFTINSTTGVVTLASSLDYEMSTEHTIKVTASNPDGRTSTPHNITILVIDENDNSPVFTMNPYTASVAEQSDPGTQVITVQADDADSGVLGQVRYSITSGNIQDVFIIDSINGTISTNDDIDREMLDAYTLGVTATDVGGRSAQSTVEISITDINDNSPVFDPSSYSMTVYENATVNSTLISVTATDADTAGPNSDISYSIQSGNDDNLFGISSTGEISIISELDFETATSHSLIVQAMDNGTPSRSSTAVVSVTVLDINDVAISLGNDQVVSVTEYATVSSRITQFRTSNVEQSDNISDFMLSGDQVENFMIDAATGVVTLAQSLDYEVTRSYALTVTVSDGIFSSSAQLTVNVLDENDNQPIINATDPFMIEEEMGENAVVGQVTATDEDSGLNGEIQFSIVSNIGDDLFTINASTGMIHTTAVLDREVLVNMNLFTPPQSQQVLVVQAEDRGMPSLFSQADVTIQLLDINDNSPQFVNELPSSISFSEDIINGTFILDASATDADLGANGEVSYSLTSDTSSLPFSIDPSTGAVTTIATLDRETIDFYTLRVTATDSDTSNQLMSSVVVNVTVTDVNDNAPMFLGAPYEESIPEDATTDGGGSIDLVTVAAIDLDIGLNALVTYSVAPNTNSRFSLRNGTGQLRVSGGINFEEQTEFFITVIARDMGDPSLASTTVVKITIINVDEFAPMFLGSCDASISETREVSRNSNPVTQCVAVDRDSGMISYSIQIEASNPALSAFLLDQGTGELYLTQSLDREMIDSYQFTLEATSGFLVTRMLVTITVEDVNDNVPVITPSQTAVTYSDPQAQTITTLTVSDDDINENGEFSVAISSVDRTSQPDGLDTHEIIITAEDMGTPSMSGNATVVVTNGFPCQIMEFSLDTDTLELNVDTLCSLSNPPVSQDYLIGTEVILDCSAVSNLPVTYQWQLDGSFITTPSSDPKLDLGAVDFNAIGSYSCIARNTIGSIQSVTAFIGVHVLPEIVRPPATAAVQVGDPVTLTCVSEGIPPPTVTFYFNDEEMKEDDLITINTTSHIMTITRVDKSHEGEYRCSATNVAGSVESNSVTITVFDAENLVNTTVTVSNPSEDGTCHNFDPAMLAEIIKSSTGRNAEVNVVPTGELCDVGACYPNPCSNNGQCGLSANSAGGYQCVCPDTYTGRNCSVDVDECVVNAPCLFGGTCTNTPGFFSCSCPPDRRGHRCQYEILCDNSSSRCADGETCVETLANVNGFVCDSTPANETLTIQLNNGVTPEILDEQVYNFINLLQQMTLDNNARKRRQSSSDFCEPRFILDNESYKLVWACPNGTSPDLSSVMLLCQLLLDNDIVTNCTYPNGTTTSEPAPEPLEPIKVEVNIVLIGENNTVLTGDEAVDELSNSDTQDDLMAVGIVTDEFTAVQPSPQPSPLPSIVPPKREDDDDDDGLSGGAIAGIVIAVIVAAIILAVIIVIVVVVLSRRRGSMSVKWNDGTQKVESIKRAPVTDTRQSVVGVFQNPMFVEDSKEAVNE